MRVVYRLRARLPLMDHTLLSVPGLGHFHCTL